MAEEKEDYKTTLIKNTPLALVILGLVLILAGATGGISSYASISDTSARILVSVVGAVVAAFGGALIWRARSESQTAEDIKKRYGFAITNPPDRSEVDEYVDLSGNWKGASDRPHVVIIEQSPNSRKYWFKDLVYLDNSWHCRCRVGGEAGNDRIIHVAVVGKNGKALEEYYRDAGTENKHWAGIKTLTDDIVLCASIQVHKRATRSISSS